jgi:uncharacterized protein YciI
MVTDSPTIEEENILASHYGYLEQLTEQNILIIAGRTLNKDDRSFGIVIFKAASELIAKKIMTADPAVKAGVMRAELYPYRVAFMKSIAKRE